MNNRQRLAAVHARELRRAKEALQHSLNTEMNKQRQSGYNVSAAPQIQRLLGLEQYRLRDYNKIMSLANNPNKLREYVVAVNPETGELVSGEAALERADRRVGKAAIRASVDAEPAKELDTMVDNVADTIGDTFVDTGVLQQFESFVTDLILHPDTALSIDDMQREHPNWFASGYRGSVDYGTREMAKENAGNALEIRNAIYRLIAMEGEAAAAKRIQDNYGDLQEAAVMAAIGYKDAAASGLQSVLNILLPSAVHDRAMRGAISTMQDTIESQWEDEMD